MQFDYFFTHSVNGILDIEDIGNCAISAFNDIGEEYILIIDTNMGVTRILNFGPVVPDLETLPKKVNCNFSRINFSEGKIIKEINKFLTGGFSNITQAMEIDKDEALDHCRDLVEYMRQPLY